MLRNLFDNHPLIMTLVILLLMPVWGAVATVLWLLLPVGYMIGGLVYLANKLVHWSPLKKTNNFFKDMLENEVVRGGTAGWIGVLVFIILNETLQFCSYRDDREREHYEEYYDEYYERYYPMR